MRWLNEETWPWWAAVALMFLVGVGGFLAEYRRSRGVR